MKQDDPDEEDNSKPSNKSKMDQIQIEEGLYRSDVEEPEEPTSAELRAQELSRAYEEERDRLYK